MRCIMETPRSWLSSPDKANIPAKFVVNIRGYTADDDDMVCLDLAVDFVS